VLLENSREVAQVLVVVGKIVRGNSGYRAVVSHPVLASGIGWLN
jgi:hypothetical protein